MLAASAPEEAVPILSGTVLPLLDGGRGGVAETARLDWDFRPKRKQAVRINMDRIATKTKVSEIF